MEYKTKPTSSIPELTSTIAKKVYSKIKEYGTADAAFKAQTDSAIEPEHFKMTNDEIDRIVKELREYASGKVIVAEESHFDEETMEKVIDVEEVRYELTTENDLVSQVDSEYLSVLDILNDIEPDGIWDNFKSLYNK